MYAIKIYEDCMQLNKPNISIITISKIIDHVYTNIPSKVISHNVIPSDEVSDNDTPFIVVNIRKERFEQDPA